MQQDIKLAKSTALDDPTIILEDHNCITFRNQASQHSPYIAMSTTTMLCFDMSQGMVTWLSHDTMMSWA